MDLMNEEIIGVLPLSNVMAIMIAMTEEEDYIYYQWSDENEAIKTDLFCDGDGQAYFEVEGGDKYYTRDFVKIDKRVRELCQK